MKWWLLALLVCINTHAADEKQTELKCEGYTMYTHPDKSCREQLQQEYKELIKQYLDKVRSKANGSTK